MHHSPEKNCPVCPRLVTFRHLNEANFPDFFNGAVPAFGSMDAALLVVGLAPGLKGANATGRPFTGDYAGDVLYEGLLKTGFAKGDYAKHAGDGLELLNCRITNAVRCVPPENKPTTAEIKECNGFLSQEIKAMPNLKVILSLGGISHKAVLTSLGFKQSYVPFQHAAVHELEEGLLLIDSYHCSRYNINTNRLTQAMFDEVLEQAKERLA
ncbi:MAG: uracil-DNA glycosylase [Rickettsiales bacterium]|nr:uracil-DNA glycosylase [Rickettsiales bacterium]